jgi:hypothetical protein
MNNKKSNVYRLQYVHPNGEWCHIGIFSTKRKALKALRKCPKEFHYIVNESKLNKQLLKKNKKCKFIKQTYWEDHCHFGVDYIIGEKKKNRYYVLWPPKDLKQIYIDTPLHHKKDKKLIKRFIEYRKKLNRTYK